MSGKIHRAVVTQSELDYVGSITIDETLMLAAGFLAYEQVHVVNVDNGKRVVTYIIPGDSNSGIICLNGAAAHHFEVGDKVIIMGYASIPDTEVSDFMPKVVFVDEKNQITQVTRYEQHGLLNSNN